MHIEQTLTQRLEIIPPRDIALTPILQKPLAQLTVLQTALSVSGLGLWTWNLVTKKIQFSCESKQILGYTTEEIYHSYTSFLKLVHPQDVPKLRSLQAYFQGYTSIWSVELRIISKSGEWKWILIRGKGCEWDESGSIVQIAGTLKDITEEKQSAVSLKLLKAIDFNSLSSALQSTVEQVQQGLQTDRTIIYQFYPNSSGAVIFECTSPSVTSLKGIDIQNTCLLPTDTSVYSRSSYHKIEEIATENLSPWQICFLNKFAIRASLAIPIMIADTSQLWGLLIVQDCTSSRKWQQWEIDTLSSLTSQIAIAASQSQAQETQASLTEKSQQLENTLKELKDFQEQLLHNDKLASLGQIVINLTNEINNIINFIHSSVYITNKYTEDLIDFVEYKQFPVPTETTLQLQRLELDFIKTDFLKLVWSMRASCERIREIFSALQYLSLDENQMQKADLHQGFDHVLKILQHRLKERADRRGIQVVKEFGILPLIKCYKNDLNQVFIHILNNAIDALEEKIKEDNTFVPQIWISTEIVSSHLSLVRDNEVAGVGQLKKCKVIIRISDNGKGMLPHIQRQIFEPFFTTKPASRGLGLYISQQIIARQGKLKCNSRLGQGTEFIIEINTTIKPNADII